MHELEEHPVVRDQVDFASIFPPECIETIPDDAIKQAVLHRLASSLARRDRLPRDEVRSVVNGLLEREQFGTTALGKGLAFPNLRTRAVNDFAGAIGVAPGGVEFGALDGLPTRLIILLLSPFASRERHCEIMGRLAALMTDKTLQYSLKIPRSPESLLRFLSL